ncbi:MAG TPA: hypothetical protein ENJ08_12300 [Gammaproteobacteria bacterium]|nr:hypothetical protein [Gammaproteobacteria bacterium]
MAISAKQKQKKLEKKNKKRKQAKKSGVGTQHKSDTLKYASFPVHECFIPNSLFESGLGVVIISRRAPDGSIAASAFVVDMYCLGVKNTLFKVSGEAEYENTVKPSLMREGEAQYENVPPACAVKVIKGAVLYANELGFSPHRDYKEAKNIFGNIDASSCSVKYEYGQDGKPCYIRGPGESALQAKRIIDQLDKKFGEGSYEGTIMLDEDMY